MNEEKIKELQEIVDSLRKTEPYRQYVASRKLGMLDSRLSVIDKLLEVGILH